MYPRQYQSNFKPTPNGDRQFVFPFLVGALTGGAAVGLTRPRPIYNVAPPMGPGPSMHHHHQDQWGLTEIILIVTIIHIRHIKCLFF